MEKWKAKKRSGIVYRPLGLHEQSKDKWARYRNLLVQKAQEGAELGKQNPAHRVTYPSLAYPWSCNFDPLTFSPHKDNS